MKKLGPVVVITGASAGIGRAAVREFARKGARIGLIARGHDGLEGAKRDVEKRGGEAIVLPTDVADADAVERAAQAVEERFGPIDVWVNDAFANVFAECTEIKAEEYRRITEVTYLGYVWGTLAALRRMMPRDRGTIVQVGSALAYRSIPLQAAYCASKSAIRGFTDSVRCELHHRRSKVRISMVQMPALNTPQFSWTLARLPRKPQPVPPIFQPEVAGRAIVWASRHAPRELWVGSSTVKAIVGTTLIPGLLDRYLGKVGYDAQQYDGALDKDRRVNLWEPVPGDHGAHGAFDKRARTHSWQLFWTMRSGWLLATVGVFGLASLMYVRLSRAE